MNIKDIIENKKRGNELTKEEIEFFVNGYTKGEITDYQASALIMAICLNGMVIREISDLTMAMAYSGEVLDLSDIAPNIVDKHSTGGVGDKITLILMPIIASIGVPVAKMSGRGLGITGGTVDKLQSIPGYVTDIDIKEFKQNVKEIGISLISQSMDLAPADKKIYALRDATACVDSIPLIASSIMSKKIASGAKNIILDVTCGKGAFMETKKDARVLSKLMKYIGKNSDRNVMCILTNMNEPVGYSVGNSLEVVEAVKALKGDMSEDVKEIILTFGSYMLKMAGLGDNIEENKARIMKEIESGKAYDKFVEVVKKQGGDISYIENLDKFEKAPYIMPVLSPKAGYVADLSAELVGRASVELGAGRQRKEDEIDPRVGIIVCKKTGDKVEKEEAIAYVHANSPEKAEEAVLKVKNAYTIVDKKVKKPSVILEIL
ncbi:MAG: thymidine phosphorylase [Clostridia bacterium]|nr:thymidine phosphorylase [Clostridia bacterium]